MTDADVDGAHIRTLLLTFFFRHMVDLINQGHLFIAQPPLYRAVKGKNERWLYSEKELASLSFDDLDVHTSDGAVKLGGADLADMLVQLNDVEEGMKVLYQKGFTRDIVVVLLQNDIMHRLKYPTQQEMAAVKDWFVKVPGVTVESHFDIEKQEYSIEITLGDKKLRVDRALFDDPVIAKSFRIYPMVRYLDDKKRYTVLKNKKETAKDLPWDELATVLKKASDNTGLSVQRYKGLGEMSAEQLWSTTMNPDTRTLLEVTVEDAGHADQLFNMLMGEEVPPRKAYIQAHAKSVKNLDI
jgi:DNA gyrase subunit B